MKQILKYKFSFIFWLTVSIVYGQSDSLYLNEKIAVTGRPSVDSITLRWAPLNLKTWQKGNSHGYLIERYVIARDERLVSPPEKSILTATPIKPLPENKWESIVKKDRYAAITAQALFGDNFEVDLTQSDVFTIVNKVQENEQRYSFSLFCADMSPIVAKTSGLWFTDKYVKKGEKYLYRITVNSIDSLRGSIYVSPDDQYNLPEPKNLNAGFKDKLVTLRWDRAIRGKYTAHIVERSTDGKNFTAIADSPLVTMSPVLQEDTRYVYAIDSLQDLVQTYYYRVKGVTPFGEEGQPSDIVTGKGDAVVADPPYINKSENIENKSILITWEFPQENNSAIKGFTIERSSRPKGTFNMLTLQHPLSPETRSYEDKSAQQVNYYRVTALGVNGTRYSSPLYLAQLIDSIPPLPPVGLKGIANEFGSVNISWAPNNESDIHGYRIYKGNYETEEFSQITREPVARASYIDNINLNTLNESVYYMVMAVDKNQNHSELSAVLKIQLPDRIKPASPVLLPVKSSNKGVVIPWIRSSSDDVVQYDLYRSVNGKREWQRIKVLQSTEDSVYTYFDSTSIAGAITQYTVTAIDDSGLESEPAFPVNAVKLNNHLRPPINWKDPVMNKESMTVNLSWNYDLDGVSAFKIYKAVDEKPPVTYKTILGDKKEFQDKLQPGKKFTYRILVIFKDGFKSSLSEEISVNY